jgi:hypothetical protein
MVSDSGEAEQHGQDPATRITGNELNAKDERIWRLWMQGIALTDYRSHGKAVAWLARLAMIDEEFRHRLINDTHSALSELPSDLKLPEGMTVRFLENTQDTLNIVLPPQAGGITYEQPEFHDELESRTSDGFPIFHDNFDIGPGKDPDFRDIVILNVGPETPVKIE